MFEWEPRKSEMWNAVVIVICMCLFPELSWPKLEANYIPERVSFIIFAWFKLLGRNQPSECSYDAPESQLPGFESQAISSH